MEILLFRETLDMDRYEFDKVLDTDIRSDSIECHPETI